MSNPEIDFPKRLIEDETATGKLLRQSLEESWTPPSESACYHGLIEKRTPDRRTRVPWVLAFATASAMAASIVFLLVRRSHEAVRVTASADRVLTEVATRPLRASELGSAVQPPAEVKPSRITVAKTESKDLASAHLKAQGTSTPDTSMPATSADTARCAGLAREGNFEPAAACYDTIAQGHGMASELALYEKARLESRALGRGVSALATLDEHARRFPKGVLATEAELTRIELLSRLGRGAEALSAIDRALAGAMGRERGGDLQLIRGDLLSKQGDCKAALVAYAAARSAGIHPSRLRAGEQRCASSNDVSAQPRTKEEVAEDPND